MGEKLHVQSFGYVKLVMKNITSQNKEIITWKDLDQARKPSISNERIFSEL